MDDTTRDAITASILKSNEVWAKFSGKERGFVSPVEGVVWGCSSRGALYWIKVDGLWGLYDFEKGDYANQSKYRCMKALTGAMFQVWEGERWGIIDTESLEVSWNI